MKPTNLINSDRIVCVLKKVWTCLVNECIRVFMVGHFFFSGMLSLASLKKENAQENDGRISKLLHIQPKVASKQP